MSRIDISKLTQGMLNKAARKNINLANYNKKKVYDSKYLDSYNAAYVVNEVTSLANQYAQGDLSQLEVFASEYGLEIIYSREETDKEAAKRVLDKKE